MPPEPDATASSAIVQRPISEEPLVTLAIAAGMVFFATGAYAIHALRSRRRRAREAPLIIRHITTIF
ncbi:MAG TPA: hypothetical protein VHK63_05860 [Candidatus Limnocylindria bacterium]|nr:hypothetical protein [Candidatus Limnocylindria bacterium]